MGDIHFTVGCCGIVNGKGAEPFEGFIPTRHELLQLVKYWATTKLENRWLEFQTGQFDATEASLILFAADQIKRISSLLGDAAVNEAVNEVKAQLHNKVSEEQWQIFVGGNRAEWESVKKKQWNDWNKSLRKIKQNMNAHVSKPNTGESIENLF
jgi:hypothetical protein